MNINGDHGIQYIPERRIFIQLLLLSVLKSFDISQHHTLAQDIYKDTSIFHHRRIPNTIHSFSIFLNLKLLTFLDTYTFRIPNVLESTLNGVRGSWLTGHWPACGDDCDWSSVSRSPHSPPAFSLSCPSVCLSVCNCNPQNITPHTTEVIILSWRAILVQYRVVSR